MRAQALYCWLRLLRAWPGLRAQAWTAGLAPKPGPHRLGLLVDVVKAQARMLGQGPTQPYPLFYLIKSTSRFNRTAFNSVAAEASVTS
jgi:hypothetical protein